MTYPSKFEILSAELAVMEAEVAKKRAYLNAILEQPLGISCGACGENLKTEADFQRHFVISRMNRIQGYLNLGECPRTEKGRNIIDNAGLPV